MSYEDKTKRLEQLYKIEYPSDQDLEEIDKLKQELELIDTDNREQEESIEPIQKYRKSHNENKAREQELAILRRKRKEIETRLNIIKEKKRIEKIKKELDGMVYCDDCHKWVWPSHFD